MKGVYRADAQTKAFVSSDLVPDDYVLKTNETFENPSGKLEPAKLSGTTWVDATQEEHQAYLDAMQQDYLRQHPEASQPTEPDKSDQAVNLLGQQIAKMQQQQATLMQSVNALGQMVAKATASSATQPVTPAQPADSQSAAPAQSAASAQTSAQAQA